MKSKEVRTRLFFILHYNRLDYLNTMGRFDQSQQAVKSTLSELLLYEKGLDDFDKSTLFGNIAMSFFGAGNFQQCIFWLNRIRNEIPFKIRPDLESFLRLFYILAHYEAGHADILPSLILSFYRFLHKKEQLYKFESIIIDFLRNELPETGTPKALLQAFQKLKNKIAPLSKSPYEKNVFTYFDYISWLESKIENRPFAEVVRQKAKSLPDFI
ncbi:MAG: hypothetical protein EPN85_06140 [Bacteroidetes bacterium]|nr:MAG: hypothetical protein EPN85_06140 [Bacteroidota bacterium]